MGGTWLTCHIVFALFGSGKVPKVFHLRSGTEERSRLPLVASNETRSGRYL